MQCSLVEIRERIDIYLLIGDNPPYDGRPAVHGSVVYDRPVALKAIVDINGQMRGLIIKMCKEDLWLVLEDGLQEVFMELIVFFVVGLPDRLAIGRILLLLVQGAKIVNVADLLVSILLVRMKVLHRVDYRFEVRLP